MNKNLLGIIGFIIYTLLSNSLCAASTAEHKTKAEVKKEKNYQSGEIYLPSAQQTEDIDKTLAKAKADNKLALIVLGANWCHDSRSLATKLYLPEVKETIDSNYELIFVDVGYLTKIKKVITRFGMPVIYATPTVLIIEPNSETLINRHNMHLWRDADKVSISDTHQYFADIATNKQQLLASLSGMKTSDIKTVDRERLESLNLSINQFEQRQADRIYKAFTIIGPLIEEKKHGGKAENFLRHWKAVAALRYKITDDLAIFRQQAIEIASVSNSDKQELSFPEYPVFEWELGK